LFPDVIFLESTKNDKIVERQLDHLDRFTHVNTYHDFDDEIPHLEGRIPILHQSMESPFEAPSPPHEEVPATSSEQEVRLDDVIERIEKLNLDGNAAPSQSMEQYHLIKVHQSGSYKHLKVFILMRLERQEPKVLQDKMEVM
jgi:hypothetical protein